MKLGRIVTRAAHSRDADIARALKGAQAKPSTGHATLLAFRNDAGELYRYACVDANAQLRYLRARLTAMELLSGPDDTGGVLQVLGSVSDAHLSP